MEGEWLVILRAFLTACAGVYFLACAIQGWFLGGMTNLLVRGLLLVAALLMIEGGWVTDLVGIGRAALGYLLRRFGSKGPGGLGRVRGAD